MLAPASPQYTCDLRDYHQHFLQASYPSAIASDLFTCRAFEGFILPQSFLLWYLLPVAESHTMLSPEPEEVLFFAEDMLFFAVDAAEALPEPDEEALPGLLRYLDAT